MGPVKGAFSLPLCRGEQGLRARTGESAGVCVHIYVCVHVFMSEAGGKLQVALRFSSSSSRYILPLFLPER